MIEVNMPNQDAKADQEIKQDEGKLKLTDVSTDFIRSVAKLEDYDKKAEERLVPKLLYKTRKVKSYWLGMFECPYCGKNFEAIVGNVLSGKQHSCGCQKARFLIESKGTHGGTGTRLFRIWLHIQDRCNHTYCKEYKWYGERGIKCEFNSFEEFRDFAYSHGYDDTLTIERINVNGNYSPDNVIFIPSIWQQRNTRRNVKISYKGVEMCAAEWARLLGVKSDTLTKRKREGWDDAKILETRVGDSLDITLVPISIIPRIKEVRLWALRKYPNPNNWKRVDPQRFMDAAFRHFLLYIDDPNGVDDESGLPHLSHLVTNLAFLCEFAAGNVKGVDYKVESPNPSETIKLIGWREYGLDNPPESGIYEFMFDELPETFDKFVTNQRELYYDFDRDVVLDKEMKEVFPKYWRYTNETVGDHPWLTDEENSYRKWDTRTKVDTKKELKVEPEDDFVFIDFDPKVKYHKSNIDFDEDDREDNKNNWMDFNEVKPPMAGRYEFKTIKEVDDGFAYEAYYIKVYDIVIDHEGTKWNPGYWRSIK